MAVRASENLPSVKVVGMNTCKNDQNQLFRTLKITKALQQSSKQEKRLKFGKNNTFFGILICPDPITSSQPCCSLENQLHNRGSCETLGPSNHQRRQDECEIPPKPSPERISWFDLCSSSLKSTFLKPVFIWPEAASTLCKMTHPRAFVEDN